uniref:Uncharacterized protein n=1 Tax=Anguilla anguilla TaxID=7936 RepID=A0A0E9P8K2_ANGAN
MHLPVDNLVILFSISLLFYPLMRK